ncbi:MAG: GPW/gp25 family protein [Rubrivivax sp.]|nr:GPW/gp25 family protein [Rubrivivax sp.]
MNSLARRLFGAGLAMPVAVDDGGALVRADGPEKVRQSIAIILDTEPGERLMRPAFGCGLRRFLMQPNTTATRAQMQREIEQALRSWEPRIAVEQVQVLPGEDPAMVLVQIQYTHLRDGRRDNLVYPFYLE